MSANDKQVGGGHYKGNEIEHWDLVDMYQWDYFQAQIIKYVMRHKKKKGPEDLQKAIHFLEKYIELKYSHEGIVQYTSQGTIVNENCDCGGVGQPSWLHRPSCPLSRPQGKIEDALDDLIEGAATSGYVDQD